MLCSCGDTTEYSPIDASDRTAPDSATATPDRPIDHRRIWRLAGPIILSNVSVPLVGAVDTAVVGRLPDPAAIGAVALGAVVFGLVFWAFAFLRMGTTGFVAQAYGIDDRAEIAATLTRALLLALGFGALLIALRGPIGALAFQVAGGPERVQALAREYYAIRVWAAPATLVNYALLGCLIGLQATGAVLALQLLLNLSNVALDLLLVAGFGYGVAGVAAASLAAELLTAALGLLWLWRRLYPGLPSGWLRRLRDAARFRLLARANLDILIRTVCLSSAWFFFVAQSGTLGATVLAANALLLHFQNLMAHALDGFAHAAEALAGSAYGARRRAAFITAVRLSTFWAVCCAAGMCLLYGLAGEWLIALLTTNDDVRAAAARYLPWQVALPLLAVWGFQLDGIFIGTTQTARMRNAMLVALAGFVLSVWLLLPAFGNHGLWLALSGFMLLRALTLAWQFPDIIPKP